mgnify:CR=1 FL=1
MYSYTYIAHNRPNNNVSTPNRTPLGDALITSITPSEVTGSVQNLGVPVTFTFTGSFTYADVPATGDALVSGALSGTLSSKSVYVNGALNFEETWAEGTDWLLGDTDFAYELSKLSGNDYFEGSSATGRNDTVQGLGGNDRFKGFGSTDGINMLDRFYGGDGVDTSVYQGKISEYSINSSKGTDQSPHIWDSRVNTADTPIEDGVRTPGFYVRDTVSNRDDLDTLAEVERLQFSDKSLALDVGATQNAGKAKLFTGAIAHSLVNDAATLGTILHFIDNGYSDLTSLSKLAIDAGLISTLAGSSSNEALAGLVTTNLLGQANVVVEVMLLGYMNGTVASFSQEQFLGAVAALEINQQRVDLVGLAETGMEYIPLGL